VVEVFLNAGLLASFVFFVAERFHHVGSYVDPKLVWSKEAGSALLRGGIVKDSKRNPHPLWSEGFVVILNGSPIENRTRIIGFGNRCVIRYTMGPLVRAWLGREKWEEGKGESYFPNTRLDKRSKAGKFPPYNSKL
jgi:hypothetical protein